MGSKLIFNLYDLERLELGESGARPAIWQGREALYLEKMNSAVFIRDEIPYDSYRIQAEVAIPEYVGFIGLVFGVRDEANYELVYLAPEEIQYDPIMNGSMTWQIYNGSWYQKPLPNMTGKWTKLTVEVQRDGAVVFLGDDPEEQLMLTNLVHGDVCLSKIGFWSFLPSYIRNLIVEEVVPRALNRRTTDLTKLREESYITDWKVYNPYLNTQGLASLETEIGIANGEWVDATVEENGTLNLNRVFKAEPGFVATLQSEIIVSEDKVTELTLGFSDFVRLWINDQEIYQGEWSWQPPLKDGRIRPNHNSVEVKWKQGINTIRAEVGQREGFGWGLTVKTGLGITK